MVDYSIVYSFTNKSVIITYKEVDQKTGLLCKVIEQYSIPMQKSSYDAIINRIKGQYGNIGQRPARAAFQTFKMMKNPSYPRA